MSTLLTIPMDCVNVEKRAGNRELVSFAHPVTAVKPRPTKIENGGKNAGPADVAIEIRDQTLLGQFAKGTQYQLLVTT